jgi:hypothetical protein
MVQTGNLLWVQRFLYGQTLMERSFVFCAAASPFFYSALMTAPDLQSSNIA